MTTDYTDKELAKSTYRCVNFTKRGCTFIQNSHFKLLMKTLGMTEQALADIINVDKTLVNKWKNGKRDFDLSSPYFDAVVQALVMRSASLSHDILAANFKASGKALINKVSAYLAEPDAPSEVLSPPEDGIKVPLVIFEGCESHCRAFNYFTKEANKYENEDIYIVMTQDMTCSGNDSQCVSMMLDFIKNSLSRAKSINVVFRYSDTEMFNEQLMMLATLSLNKNLNIYVKFSGKEIIKQTYFVVGRRLTMLIHSNSQKPVMMQFLVYENDRLCEFQIRRYRTELATAVELSTKYTLGGSHNVIKEIGELAVNSAPMYIQGRCPCFFAMSDSLLQKILAANDIPKARADGIVKLYQDVRKFYLKNVSYKALHEIYDLDSLTEILKEKNFFSPFLSIVAKKMIVVPRRLYSEYFSGLLAFLNSNKNADIRLSARPMKNSDPSFIYIIKQYSFGLAGSGLFSPNNILFTKNTVSVALLYDAFIPIQDTTLALNDNEATIEQFMRFLTIFKE